GHLIDLLQAIFRHPYLKDRLVLKGGTALNLFLLDLPRLSVDIDLNYIGALDRETMLAERPEVDRALQAVFKRQDLEVRRLPGEHAGGKWRLSFARVEGGRGALEVDLNFLMRIPLWAPQRRDSPPMLGGLAAGIPVVDLHELAAGKLAALFSRTAARDLFDTVNILSHRELDPALLRPAFVVSGAMSRRDWRDLRIEDAAMDPRDVAQKLLPMLRSTHAPAPSRLSDWCKRLVGECRELLGGVLPLKQAELEFLERINGQGDIRPDLLTGDPALQERLRHHPALHWKAQNVRRHLAGGSR
ncbi:nucleotidyl transferase AbiEii/AbiGii toxin family protein, partial [bacterium]|nr:nucleotidyl transferase AbiEii/AbiGii toxin family protein [bacterium]